MQHEDQHREAIAKTMRKNRDVSCGVFDDKIRDMGRVTVAKGKIDIELNYLPGMVSEGATRDFLVDAIGLALKACYDADPESFNPHQE